jgi:flagellar biosynthesis protein
MVSLLMQVDLDSRIPPELYQAVAELLAWLYRLESGMGAGEEASAAKADAAAASEARPSSPYPLLPPA